MQKRMPFSEVPSPGEQSVEEICQALCDENTKYADVIDLAAEPILVNQFDTPIGPMLVAASDSELILLEFADRRTLESQTQIVRRLFLAPFAKGKNEIIQQTEAELSEYFASKRFKFEVPFAIHGTDFEKSVWQQLLEIPVGKTKSYEQVATTLGKPRASRAVGRANGDNRLAIIIPCHRVIRTDGTLSGYAGGLFRKRWLLNHEKPACPLGFINEVSLKEKSV